jgi:hypothetical protein
MAQLRGVNVVSGISVKLPVVDHSPKEIVKKPMG